MAMALGPTEDEGAETLAMCSTTQGTGYEADRFNAIGRFYEKWIFLTSSRDPV